MKICYVDEAGCTGKLPNATSNIQPTLVFGAMIIDYGRLHYMTERLLNLKQRFFPGSVPVGTSHMGWMLKEIKGAEVRKDACEGNRNIRRAANGFLAETLKLCETCDAKLTGRIWVKGINTPMNGNSIYTFSLQSIYTDFQHYLTTEGDIGIVVVDSRLKHLNTPVAHSIFTQKFKGTGDSYDRIIELPGFSHSDNHAGLQIIDMICSGIMTPIAIQTYCVGHVHNIHVRPGYADLKAAFANQCRKLQYRYSEASGRMRGGFVVSDGINSQPGGAMFR